MVALQVEIRVSGTVPTDVLDELPGLRVTTAVMETVLSGPVRDQSELIGIINQLQGWGIELHAVRQLEPGTAPADDGQGS